MLFAVMNHSVTFPKIVAKCTIDNVRINDIIYLEVGEIKFGEARKIYCRVDAINQKSVKVTDLRVELRDGLWNFYLDETNPVSSLFKNHYKVARREMYVCDRDQFTFCM